MQILGISFCHYSPPLSADGLEVAFLDGWTAERGFVRFLQCKTRLLGIFSNLKSQIARATEAAEVEETFLLSHAFPKPA